MALRQSSFSTWLVGVMRRLNASVFVILAILCLARTTVLAQQTPWTAVTPKPPSAEALKWLPPPQDASLLTPVFLFQQNHYAVGEPILVRLGFKNMSSHVIDIRSGSPPWQESKLSITGPDGRPVPQGLLEIGGDDGSGRLFSISPGATQFIGWDKQDWYPLDHWSYHLTNPGTYRIVVRALASSRSTTNVEREQSTTVTITIDP
jgi:hypothetical protein